MNVLNMHIALQQAVDRMNSERADMLQPEERDIELNKAMLQFINQRYGRNNVHGTGFEESQKRIDDLRTLITEHEDTLFFKEELKPNKIWVDSFRLPSNYMYLVNQRGRIRLDRCRPVPFTLQSEERTIYYFSFTFTQLMVDSNAFVDQIRMQNTAFGTIPTIQELVWTPSPTLFNQGYTPGSYPQFAEEVLADMLANPQPGFQIVYENYGHLNLPGQIIVIVDVNTHPWFIWDGSNGTVTPLVAVRINTQISAVTPQVESLNAVQRRVTTNTTTVDHVLNRFSQQDDIFRLLDDPFNTTTHKEPLTTIRQNFIDVYTSALFITETLKITYLRRPRPISISLGYDCELPDHTHEEIVAMAATSILEITTDPRLKTQKGEMLSRE